MESQPHEAFHVRGSYGFRPMRSEPFLHRKAGTFASVLLPNGFF